MFSKILAVSSIYIYIEFLLSSFTFIFTLSFRHSRTQLPLTRQLVLHHPGRQPSCASHWHLQNTTRHFARWLAAFLTLCTPSWTCAQLCRCALRQFTLRDGPLPFPPQYKHPRSRVDPFGGSRWFVEVHIPICRRGQWFCILS